MQCKGRTRDGKQCSRTSRRWWPYCWQHGKFKLTIAGLVSLVVVGGAVAEFSGYSLRDLTCSSDTTALSVGETNGAATESAEIATEVPILAGLPVTATELGRLTAQLRALNNARNWAAASAAAPPGLAACLRAENNWRRISEADRALVVGFFGEVVRTLCGQDRSEEAAAFVARIDRHPVTREVWAEYALASMRSFRTTIQVELASIVMSMLIPDPRVIAVTALGLARAKTSLRFQIRSTKRALERMEIRHPGEELGFQGGGGGLMPDGWFSFTIRDYRGAGTAEIRTCLDRGMTSVYISGSDNGKSLWTPLNIPFPKGEGDELELSWRWRAELLEHGAIRGDGMYPCQVAVVLDNYVALYFTWDLDRTAPDIRRETERRLATVEELPHTLAYVTLDRGVALSATDWRRRVVRIRESYDRVRDVCHEGVNEPTRILMIGVQTLSRFRNRPVAGEYSSIKLRRL